jgi:hypothetical protein
MQMGEGLALNMQGMCAVCALQVHGMVVGDARDWSE